MKFFKTQYFLVGFSLIFLLPNFWPRPKVPLVNLGHPWESFDPNLALKLFSVDDVLYYTDSVTKVKGTDRSQLGYVNVLADIVRKRFYHGYCYYSVSENWIAAFSGILIWSHLSAIVLPDDILKYPNAACSQQSIVMMECFKRMGIPFRKVSYDHHFALEGFIKGKWYYFDPDLEPKFNKVKRTSVNTIFQKQEEYTIYESRLDSATLQWGLANKMIGRVNEAPAPQASLFHHITKVLSKTLWLVPLSIGFCLRRKKVKLKDMKSEARAIKNVA